METELIKFRKRRRQIGRTREFDRFQQAVDRYQGLPGAADTEAARRAVKQALRIAFDVDVSPWLEDARRLVAEALRKRDIMTVSVVEYELNAARQLWESQIGRWGGSVGRSQRFFITVPFALDDGLNFEDSGEINHMRFKVTGAGGRLCHLRTNITGHDFDLEGDRIIDCHFGEDAKLLDPPGNKFRGSARFQNSKIGRMWLSAPLRVEPGSANCNFDVRGVAGDRNVAMTFGNDCTDMSLVQNLIPPRHGLHRVSLQGDRTGVNVVRDEQDKDGIEVLFVHDDE